MRRYRAARSQTTLDHHMVLIGWWLITRSMVIHSVVTGMTLIITTEPAVHSSDELTYDGLLYGPSTWLWGTVLVALSSLWWIAKSWLCEVLGVLLGIWHANFGLAFLLGWIKNPESPSTTPTGFTTYFLIGWLWWCVTWIVYKDIRHVKRERARYNQTLNDEGKTTK